MGLPGRTSLARILPAAVLLTGLSMVPPGPAAAAAPAGTPGPAADREDEFAPGRLLVGFEAGAGERGRQMAAAAVDGRVVDRAGRTRVVELDPGADVRRAAERLAARPGVAFAEPDWLRRVDDCDPSVCWHLEPRPGADVAEAHAGGSRGAGRTVAVVDTGVMTGVADLDAQVSHRWRCRPPTTPAGDWCVPARARPASTHGTEVAGVVAALDNGIGTTGVAPEATVVSYRVDSDGQSIPISNLVQALDHIAGDDGIDVVNLSLSGSQWSEPERLAIDGVLATGKVVVAAAGNDGNRVPQYPAAFPGVLSVGATDVDGQVAGFSAFGKVDVVAPGDCVAVPVVLDAAGRRQRQRADCPADPGAAHYTSGTSFSAPIVAGLLALAESPSPLVARLALASSADEASPGGAGDAKRWGHGLVDAGAFLAAHDPAAPPALVLETTGGAGHDHRIGSGDGQLPHPDTTFVAYAFQAGHGAVAADPGTATFSGAASGTAAFQEVDGQDGTLVASFDSGPLGPGPEEEQASATVDGVPVEASVPVLVLEPDDQAPGVALAGDGDDAWRRVGTVDGDDLDDVYAVTLARGDRLEVTVASSSTGPVAALLFDPGTQDVLGQLDLAFDCGDPELVCRPGGLQFTASADGVYPLDLYATGSTGSYTLTWTVRNAAGPPVTVPVPACSPNGDGVRDRCAWTAGPFGDWTVTSFVTSGQSSVVEVDGTGRHDWDGGAGPGRYRLRVLYFEPGTDRVLLRVFTLVVDTRRPRIARATVAPNPFEPRSHDGDRDTASFAMTSSEAGRLRVILYRHASATVVRVFGAAPSRPAASGSAGRGGRPPAPGCGGATAGC